eukprot:gene5461-7163_t
MKPNRTTAIGDLNLSSATHSTMQASTPHQRHSELDAPHLRDT